MTRLFKIARAATLAGLISGCVAMSAPTFAADPGELPQGEIALHGADFTSPTDVAQLKRQLRHVARNICTAQLGEDILMGRSEQACYDTAVKDGLTQIDGRRQQALRERTVRLAGISNGNTSAQ